jgi:GNAT superfamily N-acetyltransferase
VVLEIRLAQPDDEPFLWDMAWEATAVDDGMRALGREAAFAIPHVRRYLDGWGRPGDAGVVAVAADGQRLGAAWYRLFPPAEPGYGYVDERTPELAIAVVPSKRGHGIGDALLRALLDKARQAGYPSVSLSVDSQNAGAIRLYERHGFERLGAIRSGESPTVVPMLRKPLISPGSLNPPAT